MNILFNKILILGNGGAGKSTLAKKLREIFKYPTLHLDKIYWIKDWQKNDLNIFDNQINAILKNPNWIIEGTPMHGIDKRIDNATLIIFIDISKLRCIFQILKRQFIFIWTFKHNDDGCPAIKLNLKTLNWIWNYKKFTRPLILEKLILTNNKVIYIKNYKDISNLLAIATKNHGRDNIST